jgi:hypothetical protein
MFEQLVDAFRMLDILQSVVCVLGWVFAIITIAFAGTALWHSMFKCGESGSTPYPENVGGFRPWLFTLLSCLPWLILIIVATVAIPPKEYIVMKAVAPQIDKYVTEHPDTLLKVENLTAIVDDTAKNVLNLVGDSSKLIKGYLEKQVTGDIQNKIDGDKK